MYVNIPTIQYLIVLGMSITSSWNSIQYVMAQPVNDVCATATVVTPLTTVSFSGDTTFATPDSLLYLLGNCHANLQDLFSVWYALSNPTNNPIEYTITTDFPETVTDTDIGIFSGDCTSLVCLGGNDDIGGGNVKSLVTFTAAPQSSYYVIIFDYTLAGSFKVSFTSTTVPTNPPTKQPTNTPTTSPTKLPTATPTASPSTAPTRDCDIAYNLYNSRTDQFVTTIMNNRTIVNSLPPCGRANIEAVVPCGVSSPNDSVVIELYRGTRLYARRTEYFEKYFLFGNSGNNINDGKIPAGTYSIRTIVDGITSPFTNFTMGGRCK